MDNRLSDYLDWSTFQMGEVFLAGQTENGLDGFAAQDPATGTVRPIDATREIWQTNGTYKVRTQLAFNPDTGLAQWYIRIVDPSKAEDGGQWPDDDTAGVLQPNATVPEGEGHITYSVYVRADAPANVVIANTASIVFDSNAAIETDPAWWNTVYEMADVEVTINGVVTNLSLAVGEPWGAAVPPDPAPRAGYTFAGWWTGPNGSGRRVTAQSFVQSGDSGLYAYWKPNAYVVRFNANGGEGEMADQAFEYDKPAALSPSSFIRENHVFVGWATNETGEIIYEDGAEVVNLSVIGGAVVDLYAAWVEMPPPVPPTPESGTGSTPESGTGPKPELRRTESVAKAFAPPAAEANVYDGYLSDEAGDLKGTVQVKVAKPKNGSAKVTATVVPFGGKKQSLKGTLNVSTGTVTGMDLTLGASGMSGTFGGYTVDGVRSPFSSKDKAEQNAANALAESWAAVNIAWNGGTLSVSFGKKGKVKVSGTLVSGTKVSMTGQLLVGEEWLCVPMTWAKKSESVAFTLWLPRNVGGNAPHSPCVIGLADAAVGKPGTLKGGASFRIDVAVLCGLLKSVTYAKYLPDGVSVAQSGAKWVVADGAKAGKVQLGKDGSVDEARAGANPSGLKLTYKAKDGSFKGSFKAYASEKGKPKAMAVNVTGVLVNGIGYGTATIKKVGSLTITIESNR